MMCCISVRGVVSLGPLPEQSHTVMCGLPPVARYLDLRSQQSCATFEGIAGHLEFAPGGHNPEVDGRILVAVAEVAAVRTPRHGNHRSLPVG